jgi:hypothetical protein
LEIKDAAKKLEPHCPMAQRASLRQYISVANNVPSVVFPRCTQGTNLIQKKETRQEIRRVLPICEVIAY